MPNYVRNELTIPDPQEADRAFTLMRSDESEFDFNRICPVPPEIYCGDVGRAESIIFAQEHARTFSPVFGAVIDETDTALNWCSHYWGTKWNAFNVKRVDATKVRFETTWSGVPRIVMLLALHERLTEFEYVWSSEDFGCECGRLVGSPMNLAHGQPFWADLNLPKAGSREAFELSSSVWPEFVSHGPKDSGWRWDELSKEIVYFDCDDESE